MLQGDIFQWATDESTLEDKLAEVECRGKFAIANNILQDYDHGTAATANTEEA